MHKSAGTFWDIWDSLALSVMGLAVAFVYGRTLKFPFIYDDMWTLVLNQAIRSPFPISKFFLDSSSSAYPPSGIPLDVYRPLSTLSFAVTAFFVGLKPVAFRLTNFVLHIGNGFLLWKILRGETNSSPAFLGALLFVLHPVQVESVVWVTQRSILICALGCLLTLYFWRVSGDTPTIAWACCASFLFALFGKETALALPILLLAQLRNRNDKRLFPVLACVPIAIGYFILRRHVLGHWTQTIQRTETPFSSLADGTVALTRYAQSVLFPFRLNVSYRWPESAPLSDARFWIGVGVLCGLVFFGLYYYRRQRSLFFGISAFFVFWWPHSGVAPLVTFAADRFLYLPMAGVAFVSVGVLSMEPKLRALAAVVLVALAIQSFRRGGDWRNEKALWGSSIRVDDRNAFALMNYGLALQQERSDAEAEIYFRKALANRPTIRVAHDVLSILINLSERRKDAAAVEYWKKKLATVPR